MPVTSSLFIQSDFSLAERQALAAKLADVNAMPLTDNEIYSNFDHVINAAVQAELEQGRTKAIHTALNFCGCVWFDNGQWHELVMRHGSPVEYVCDKSLRRVIDRVNERHGAD